VILFGAYTTVTNALKTVDSYPSVGASCGVVGPYAWRSVTIAVVLPLSRTASTAKHVYLTRHQIGTFRKSRGSTLFHDYSLMVIYCLELRRLTFTDHLVLWKAWRGTSYLLLPLPAPRPPNAHFIWFAILMSTPRSSAMDQTSPGFFL